ncbi:UV excision repair protein rhp23 [Cyphellophora attinorum]|uniref:UV excision repair protein rhp23 n=1 Tax=Cyphellophora attinorum TaxID=1664694 RepID=A0A0N0NPR5_9EURO|nr:UV excision repair protein rhp23 [Phialophora attinorum]KPI42849.1 UV excision repair protein rhp23 [Phialophora attinorum]
MSSIYEDSARVKAAFRDVNDVDLRVYDASGRQDLSDAEEHFLMWTANLGALDAGHTSLDYRLQDVPETVELVRDLLQDLARNLEGFRKFVETSAERAIGSLAPEDDSDDSSAEEDDMDELQATVTSMKNILRRLFRLARTIRNYGTRSNPGRRNVYKVPSEDRQAMKKQLISLEQRRIYDFVYFSRKSDHEGMIDASEEIEMNNEDAALIARLARACSQRRQQFVYWRYRHENSTHAAHHLMSKPDFQSEAPRPMREDAVAALTKPALVLAPSMPSSVTRVRKEQIDFGEKASVRSAVTRAPSLRGPGGQRAEWPAIPQGLKEVSDGQLFECPYCFNLCPVRYKETSAAWKSHLIHDLMPYSCTFPNCDNADHLYDSLADWTSHEMTHSKVWVCLEHTDEEFTTSNEYAVHARQFHAADANDMLRSEALAARMTGSRQSGRHCPFCLIAIVSSAEMQKHVAWHLELLALGNLPRSNGVEQGSDAGELDSKAQKLGDADSREGELDDISLPDEIEAHSPASSTGIKMFEDGMPVVFKEFIIKAGASSEEDARAESRPKLKRVRARLDPGHDMKIILKDVLSSHRVTMLDEPLIIWGILGESRFDRTVELEWGPVTVSGDNLNRSIFYVVDELPNDIQMIVGAQPAPDAPSRQGPESLPHPKRTTSTVSNPEKSPSERRDVQVDVGDRVGESSQSANHPTTEEPVALPTLPTETTRTAYDFEIRIHQGYVIITCDGLETTIRHPEIRATLVEQDEKPRASTRYSGSYSTIDELNDVVEELIEAKKLPLEIAGEMVYFIRDPQAAINKPGQYAEPILDESPRESTVDAAEDALEPNVEQLLSQSKTEGLAGEDVADLSFFRNNPQFKQLRQVVQQQPDMLEPILQQLSAGNPQLARMIAENPERFIELLAGEDDDDDNKDPFPPGTISITAEERDAIERLVRLGFDRDSCIQAYFACDKDEELAAHFLFDQPSGSDSDVPGSSTDRGGLEGSSVPVASTPVPEHPPRKADEGDKRPALAKLAPGWLTRRLKRGSEPLGLQPPSATRFPVRVSENAATATAAGVSSTDEPDLQVGSEATVAEGGKPQVSRQGQRRGLPPPSATRFPVRVSRHPTTATAATVSPTEQPDLQVSNDAAVAGSGGVPLSDRARERIHEHIVAPLLREELLPKHTDAEHAGPADSPSAEQSQPVDEPSISRSPSATRSHSQHGLLPTVGPPLIVEEPRRRKGKDKARGVNFFFDPDEHPVVVETPSTSGDGGISAQFGRRDSGVYSGAGRPHSRDRKYYDRKDQLTTTDSADTTPAIQDLTHDFNNITTNRRLDKVEAEAKANRLAAQLEKAKAEIEASKRALRRDAVSGPVTNDVAVMTDNRSRSRRAGTSDRKSRVVVVEDEPVVRDKRHEAKGN